MKAKSILAEKKTKTTDPQNHTKKKNPKPQEILCILIQFLLQNKNKLWF